MSNESHQVCLGGSQKLYSSFRSQYICKFRMPKKAENSFQMGYDAKLDTSSELDPDAVSY